MTSTSSLLFIHGIYDAMSTLGVDTYFPDRRTLAPKLPGYALGDSREASFPAALKFLGDLMGEEEWILVGHSMGGALAMELAAIRPDRVHSVINVEGVFKLDPHGAVNKLSRMDEEDIETMLAEIRTAPEVWMRDLGFPITPRNIAAVVDGATISARPLRAMARSLGEHISRPSYFEHVGQVLRRGTPVHLVAGSRTVGQWFVPSFVRERCLDITLQADAGHVMLFDDCEAFLGIARRLVALNDTPAKSEH